MQLIEFFLRKFSYKRRSSSLRNAFDFPKIIIRLLYLKTYLLQNTTVIALLLLLQGIFIPAANAQCPDDITTEGGRLTLNWSNPQNAQDPASIVYDGISYTGDQQGGGTKKWKTDVNGFSNSDINGCHTLEIMGATCHFFDGARYSAMSASICDQVNVSCNGRSDGYATICVSGSVGPYNFSWSHGDNDSLATGLAAGTYTVIVTDANGCQPDTIPVTITEPAVLAGTYSDTTMVSCKGNCDGSITVEATGGTTPYSYLWNDGQNTKTASGLCKGDYDVEITDANGCKTKLNQVEITEPKELKIKDIGRVNVTCNGYCDGFAWVDSLTEIDGGTAPYTYEWINGSGSVVATSDTAANLCAGDYSVTITDANGCTDSKATTITQPDTISAKIEIKGESCPGCCDGEVQVQNEQGGNGNYTYIWLDENGDTVSTSDKVQNTCDSIKYTVILTDDKGCSNSFETSLIANLNVQYKCDGTCPDAQATVSGGLSPYLYEWIDTTSGMVLGTNDNISCLADGAYLFKVLDADSNIFTIDFTVVNPYPMSAAITDTTMASCKGACDGSATVSASGGMLPYSYEWNDPSNQITATASNLCAGGYTVKVRDGYGCEVQASVSITEPDELMINTTSSSDALCYGSCDGQASVDDVTGGTLPYNYTWINSLGDTVASGDTVSLCRGDYTALVTDTNGCTKSAAFTISQPDSLKIIPSSTSTSCIGEKDGSASATVTGGTGGYSYSWIYDVNGSEESTTNPADSLYDGEYTLTVTDANSCSKSVPANVPSPEDPYCADSIYIKSGQLVLEWVDNIQPSCLASIWLDMNNTGSFINYKGSLNGTTRWRTDDNTFTSLTDTTRIYIANSRCVYDGAGMVLPVSLLYFTAQKEGKKVKITWGVNAAADPQKYIIERSATGKDFQPVAETTEPQSMGAENTYAALDAQPLRGVNYYRLKQIQKDGSEQKSHIVAINHVSGSFSVYPNPVAKGKKLHVEFDKKQEDELLIIVLDIYGRQIYSKVVLKEEQAVPVAIDLENKLPSGVYFVTGSSGDLLEKKRIVVY